MSRPFALGGTHSPPSISKQNELPSGVKKIPEGSTPAKRIFPVDKSKLDPKLLEAAQGMESMFLGYLMKVMRQAVPQSENSLENGATKIYRSLLDQKHADKAAKAGGVGLADLIIDYMHTNSYNNKEHLARSGTAQHMSQYQKEQQSVQGSKPTDAVSTNERKDFLSED